jgi:hypothetical protein
MSQAHLNSPQSFFSPSPSSTSQKIKNIVVYAPDWIPGELRFLNEDAHFVSEHLGGEPLPVSDEEIFNNCSWLMIIMRRDRFKCGSIIDDINNICALHPVINTIYQKKTTNLVIVCPESVSFSLLEFQEIDPRIKFCVRGEKKNKKNHNLALTGTIQLIQSGKLVEKPLEELVKYLPLTQKIEQPLGKPDASPPSLLPLSPSTHKIKQNIVVYAPDWIPDELRFLNKDAHFVSKEHLRGEPLPVSDEEIFTNGSWLMIIMRRDRFKCGSIIDDINNICALHPVINTIYQKKTTNLVIVCPESVSFPLLELQKINPQIKLCVLGEKKNKKNHNLALTGPIQLIQSGKLVEKPLEELINYLKGIESSPFPLDVSPALLPPLSSSNTSPSSSALISSPWNKSDASGHNRQSSLVELQDSAIVGFIPEIAVHRQKLTGISGVELQELLMLPQDKELGAAVDNGGCFFDALAQALNELENSNRHNEKSLRLACLAFYNKNKKMVDAWNAKESGGIGQGDSYYHVQYTAEDLEKLCKKMESTFAKRLVAWGRPTIEGRILCNVLNLPKIHLVEIMTNPENGKRITAHFIVTSEKVIAIESPETTAYFLDMPVLVVSEKQHFVPILKKQPLLTNSVPCDGIGGMNSSRFKVDEHSQDTLITNRPAPLSLPCNQTPQPSGEVSTPSLATSETREENEIIQSAQKLLWIRSAQKLLSHTPTDDELNDHLDALEMMAGSIACYGELEKDSQLQKQYETILEKLKEKKNNLDHQQDTLITNRPEPLSLPSSQAHQPKVSTLSLATSETIEANAIEWIQDAKKLLSQTPTADKLYEHIEALEMMAGSIACCRTQLESDSQLQTQCEIISIELEEKIVNLDLQQRTSVMSIPVLSSCPPSSSLTPATSLNVSSLATSKLEDVLKLIEKSEALLFQIPTDDKLVEHLDELIAMSLVMESLPEIVRKDAELKERCEVLLRELGNKINNLKSIINPGLDVFNYGENNPSPLTYYPH